MLLGSSRPCPWLILGEHGRWIDDDDDANEGGYKIFLINK